MILTDREIEIALLNGQIVVEPKPNLQLALSSTTLDLTLSDVFAVWKPIPGTTLHPGATDYSYQDIMRLQSRLQQSSYTLKPQSFVLAWTSEYVALQKRRG